ncbi:hypothetical protein BpsS36_00020 [Bacillus phage vB_BpsS-36]|uniref:Tail tape measure protein n=1 Tax=Bacillus phage vB_BpsS-36 TaxID=2419622 RepID=A0A3G3BX65_9CAUD|nr:hypothetical protein BpsS36_00020 [Bacillus phage vB_BpsS-36]
MSNTAIDILINATDKASEVMKGVGKQVENMESAMKRAEGSSKALLGIVSGVALGTIALGTRAVMQLAEIERISAQTDAVIKSTGGVANVTAKEIETMAVEMQYLTSVEHEAIRQGANLLLTFTNIRNEVGEGNDIFNRTTGIMTDLSVAMGQDTTSSATMLGKALNDPIQGITALSRVGVSFTEEQKEQVRAMQESGDLMGAQKLILEELETQYGGSAEALGGTFTGALTMTKMAFDDVWQAIMEQLNALDWLKDGLGMAKDFFLELANSITENGIRETLANLIPEGLEPMLWAIGGAILVGLVPAFYGLATAVWTALAPLLPFLAIGVAVGLLAWQIYENWEFFAPYFSTIFELVKTYAEGFKEAFMNSFQTLMASLEPLWEAVKTLLASLMPIIELIGAVLLIFMTTSLAVFNGVVSAIGPLVTAVLNLLDVVVNVFMAIISILTGDFDKAREYWTKATESSIQFFMNLWEAVKNFFLGFIDTFLSIFNSFGVDLVAIFTDMYNNAKQKVTEGIDNIISTITGWKDTFMEAGMGLITGFTDGIKKAFGKAKDVVSGGLSNLRNLLPFSPAKEGPLSDLDKSGESFFPTWFEGALDQVKPMSKAMSKAMSQITPDADKDGLQLSFTGGRQRVRQEISVRTEHTVRIEGEGADKLNSRELEDEVKRTMFDDDAMKDLRQAIRKN